MSFKLKATGKINLDFNYNYNKYTHTNYSNQTNSIFTIQVPGTADSYSVKIYNTLGQLIEVKTTTSLNKAVFKTLPDIFVSQDDRGCLVIKSPHLSKQPIVTNDIVKLYSDTEFEWLGRFDNVINSGGVKIFPESFLNFFFSKKFQ